MSDDTNDVLREHLIGQGYSEEKIASVLEELQQHDQRTVRDSVFDSIERGTFDIETMIRELESSTESTGVQQ